MRKVLSKMQPCITVLTHISSDVSQPSLILTAKSGEKYMIGRFAEGFQRSIGEMGVRTSKLTGIFLTGRHRWSSVSGLPGALLSFAEKKQAVSRLHTGPGVPEARVARMIDTWSTFTFHSPLRTEPDSSTYTDENVEICPLSINGDSTSYIVQMQPTRGRFMVEKAKALGVPSGALFRQLSEGNSITVPGTDKVVRSHEVMGPQPIPARALVLDLPTMAHVAEALEESRLATFWSETPITAKTGFDLKAVYYFFGGEVDLRSPAIESLMLRLSGPYTKHYISHPSTSPDLNTLHTISSFQSAFRSEFPDHFSLLYSNPAASELPSNLTALRGENSSNSRVSVLQQQHTLSLLARDTDQGNQKRSKKPKVELEWTPPIPEAQGAVEGLSSKSCSELSEPEVITLGTGASAPSKYRNVSGTLVRTRAGSFLFDCGEGTFNTMVRLYGPTGLSQHLRDLRVLYISHMHADHHLGAQQVLRAWLAEARKLDLPKLVLATPVQFHLFIKEWAALDSFQDDLDKYVTFLDLESVCVGKKYSSTEQGTQQDVHNVARTLVSEAGDIEIATCIARHSPYSYNGTIALGAGANGGPFKVSYSGDTRPNRFFANGIGQGSDLLIHEATHENELAEEAAKKRHSTIGEAIGIARLMGAHNSILTHISQRYPRLPTIGADDSTSVGEGQYVCFGFDGMHTKVSEIKTIQEMVPRMGELLESLEAAAPESPIDSTS